MAHGRAALLAYPSQMLVIGRFLLAFGRGNELFLEGEPASHPVWRDAEAALIATQRLVRLAEKHGKRVHVLHVSTVEEMAFLAGHKDWASVEVTPHHLTLTDEACLGYDTNTKVAPPLRGDADRLACRRASLRCAGSARMARARLRDWWGRNAARPGRRSLATRLRCAALGRAAPAGPARWRAASRHR